MARTSERLMEMYEAMYAHFGPQGWWPGDGLVEIMIGAVLTQNTNWTNADLAIDNLRSKDMIDIEKLAKIDQDELAELIRPAGYFKVKAKRLKNLVNFIWREYGGHCDRLFQLSIDELRERLVSVNGIGRETADDIVLYAAEKPTFVVDTYTSRIMIRHNLITEDDDYESIKQIFEDNLPADLDLFKEYHALLVAVGKRFCRRSPRCDECPLAGLERDIELSQQDM